MYRNWRINIYYHESQKQWKIQSKFYTRSRGLKVLSVNILWHVIFLVQFICLNILIENVFCYIDVLYSLQWLKYIAWCFFTILTYLFNKLILLKLILNRTDVYKLRYVFQCLITANKFNRFIYVWKMYHKVTFT